MYDEWTVKFASNLTNPAFSIACWTFSWNEPRQVSPAVIDLKRHYQDQRNANVSLSGRSSHKTDLH